MAALHPGDLSLAIEESEGLDDYFQDETLGSSGGQGFSLDLEDLAFVSESREKEIHDAFHAWDSDQDGKISMEELADCLRGLGYNNENVQGMCDARPGSKVSLEEFLRFVRIMEKDRDPQDDETRLRNAFKRVDLDGNNKLDFGEFSLLLKLAGRTGYRADFEDARLLFNKIDKDGSGTIEWDEFVEYLYK
mmetsp:Transcript_1620/g.2729  ORF Transcript_1620/g.2729 Transcript_1620/m.2729 type:complete len:191 (+) Transcript_1620:231-803(+)|eukprot:CAMPEP_0184706250 /NCGR_PEP_ID=MMETSP0313-20130426/36658_1 /TAXON_ID=2792 /ORGANISM="Porphyridium aerugineum, Strain SAG 1380-2" /LENGTH=190 /DNA_ID=CAMNT_0027167799 /DNA_START=195 /DNA_END=767 /DNA_ORIENTATION=+